MSTSSPTPTNSAAPSGNDFGHVPVLLSEVGAFVRETPALSSVAQPVVIDCTLGAGGHSYDILRSLPSVRLVGIDRDGDVLKEAAQRLSVFGDRVTCLHGEFSSLSATLSSIGIEREHVAVVLADLGVSSMQLDDPSRGFSFSKEGPLDMRMDRQSSPSAREIVNDSSVDELVSVFKRGGLGPASRTLARAIVDRRPLATTAELARVCAEVLSPYSRNPAHRSRSYHPATLAFQAIRVEVNQEFKQIESLLAQSKDCLSPGGRLIVIAFHSAEDKIVASTMRGWASSHAGKLPVPVFGRLLTKKAVTASDEESDRNSRSKSALLRVFERSFPNHASVGTV